LDGRLLSAVAVEGRMSLSEYDFSDRVVQKIVSVKPYAFHYSTNSDILKKTNKTN